MTEQFRVATPRVAAGGLFRDADGSVLLVKPTYKDGTSRGARLASAAQDRPDAYTEFGV